MRLTLPAGRRAGEQSREHAAQGVDIPCCVADLTSLQLFRSHTAGTCSEPGNGVGRVTQQTLRHAMWISHKRKLHQSQPPGMILLPGCRRLAAHRVERDRPMHQPQPVQMSHPPRQLQKHAGGLVGGHRSAASEFLFE